MIKKGDLEEKVANFQHEASQKNLSASKAILLLKNLCSSPPSFNLKRRPLALDGNKVFGTDMHKVFLIAPPAPPVLLGPFPLPFIGSLEVPSSKVKHDNNNVACSGIKVKGTIFAHKGPILANVPNIVAELPGPRILPQITITANHDKKVYINNTLVLTSGKAKVSGCNCGAYFIIPSQISSYII